MNNNVSIIISFFAGIATFISPCLLPMIPLYISYITGSSIENLTTVGKPLRMLPPALFFVLGFTLVFVLLGASATYLGNLLIQKQEILRYVGGAIVIIFGLHITGLIKIKSLYKEKKIRVKNKFSGYFGAFIMGFVFAIGWTPCVGPILASILVMASTEKTVLKGIILLFCYSIGLGVPFILTSLLINTMVKFLKKIQKFYRRIELCSGIILIIAGIFIIVK